MRPRSRPHAEGGAGHADRADRTDRTGHAAHGASVGGLALNLSDDLIAGRWPPADLDRRLVQYLVVSSAGDGPFTAQRLRTELWEGGEPLLRRPDGRFTELLARLVPAPASVADDAAVHALLRRLTRAQAPAPHAPGDASGA
ncbi:hypothetical protein [Streptomyces sp. NPDC058612]|uniref:hypothetical protein n=1 Tax=Streptomyces sp. NPDC058612 TaxID=3346555 RepID=UPI00365CEC7D